MEIELLWFVVTLCITGAIAGITAGLFGNGGGFVVVPALLAVFPFYAPIPRASESCNRHFFSFYCGIEYPLSYGSP